MKADLVGALQQLDTSWSAFEHKGKPMTKDQVRKALVYGIKKGYKHTGDLTDEDIDLALSVFFRPKNGHELLQALRENKKCEIVVTYAFLSAKALEDNKCEFSFSFKLSKWNNGWAGFERC